MIPYVAHYVPTPLGLPVPGWGRAAAEQPPHWVLAPDQLPVFVEPTWCLYLRETQCGG